MDRKPGFAGLPASFRLLTLRFTLQPYDTFTALALGGIPLACLGERTFGITFPRRRCRVVAALHFPNLFVRGMVEVEPYLVHLGNRHGWDINRYQLFACALYVAT
jgi:hypothetical protein